MIKKCLAITLIASSYASTILATNTMNKLIIKPRLSTYSMANSHKTINKPNQSYIDFSGTWVPNCGEGMLEPIMIENDANYINFDGKEHRIGKGIIGESESNELGNGSDFSSFDWNEDKSALIMKNVGFHKDNTNNSSMNTYISNISLKMNNGRIELDAKGIVYSDMKIEKTDNMHCIFNKKQ